MKVGCTGYRYCLPRLSGVAIPDRFVFYNRAFMYEKPVATKNVRDFPGDTEHVSQCTGCRECEKKCPQGLPVAVLLEDVKKLFGV